MADVKQFKRLCDYKLRGGQTEPLLVYTPRYGKIPRWMRRILDKHYGGEFPHCLELFDHWGKIGETFTTEPYGLEVEGCAALLAFCKKHKLHFRITSASGWYPTRTVLILIAQTKV